MTEPVGLQCLRCGTLYAPEPTRTGCDRCTGALASNLRVRYDAGQVRQWNFLATDRRERGMRRFSAMLPLQGPLSVTLGEGDTPLHASERLGAWLGLDRLYIKDESGNPTQSYKDRLSAVAVSYARQVHAPVVATASSGNAGASLAAYAARAGLPCVVASMKGAAGPMVTQIRKLGAHLVLMEDKGLRWPLLAEAARRHGWFITSPHAAPVVGSTPIGIEGYKTIAYELFESLGGAPHWIALPVCYGDAMAGIHQGFLDLQAAGLVHRLPRFVAAEAHGSLAQAQADGADHVAAAPAAYTALAASVGAAQSAYQALLTLRDTDSVALRIDNGGLVQMQERVGALEGLCFELASVMPFEAVRRLRAQGVIRRDDVVVCLATASGLKDTDKSTLEWDELPITAQPLEQVLEVVRRAAQQTAAERFNPSTGVKP